MGNVAIETLKLSGEALLQGNEEKALEAFEKEKRSQPLRARHYGIPC